MGDLKETFMKKYGVWEYLLFLGGALMFGRVIYMFMIGRYDDAESIADLAVPIGALALSILMFAIPMTLIDAVRKKAGIETKQERFK